MTVLQPDLLTSRVLILLVKKTDWKVVAFVDGGGLTNMQTESD